MKFRIRQTDVKEFYPEYQNRAPWYWPQWWMKWHSCMERSSWDFYYSRVAVRESKEEAAAFLEQFVNEKRRVAEQEAAIAARKAANTNVWDWP